MTAPTHRMGGIASGSLLAAILHTDVFSTSVLLISALLGSLLPDIDNPHSSISRRWRIISLFISIGQEIIRAISMLFPAKQKRYIRSLIGHRGITHSFLAAVLVPAIFIFLGRIIGDAEILIYIAYGLFGGIISHIVLDMFAGGVPLFMPFSIKRIRLAGIKTGGTGEWIFRAVLVIVFIYFGMEVVSWRKLLQLQIKKVELERLLRVLIWV